MHLDSVTEAVRCGVRLQRAVERNNRLAGITPLGSKVAVVVGDPADGHNSFERSVAVARQILEQASSGHILVSRRAASLLPTGSDDNGFSVPIVARDHEDAVEVAWHPRHPPPLPSMLDSSDQRFVGREQETRWLEGAWERAKKGQRQVLLIAGEPGIGKTALARQLAMTAHDEGATVLFGRCDEETLVPFQPFVEALRHYVTTSGPSELRSDMRSSGGELVRLIPELGQHVPDLPEPLSTNPETERYRLFEAVSELLEELAGATDLVLVLDDLQWADESSLLLLRHLARRLEPRPILIVGTYRDTELTASHPLTTTIAELRRERDFDRLSLGGLDETGIASLVDTVATEGLGRSAPTLAHALRRETDGNPFFVVEVLRHLDESGAVRLGGRDQSVYCLPIFDGVREVVLQRVRRLEEGAATLSVAAVLGQEFDFELLERLSGPDTDPQQLLDVLDSAVHARLLAEVPAAGRYRFAHALTRQILYEELTRTRRAHLHRQVAEALEGLVGETDDGRLAELAYHFSRAAPSMVDKAVEYSKRAGDTALRLLAYEEASRSYRMALDVLDQAGSSDPRRNELLLALGDAQWRAGETPASRKTFLEAAEAARAVGSPEQLGRAALGFPTGLGGGVVRVGEVDNVVVGLLEEAAGVLDDDSALRAKVLARLAMELYFSGSPRSRSLSWTALQTARRISDPAALIAALNARHYAEWGPDNLEERLSVGAELIAVAEQHGDKEMVLEGRHWRVADLLEAGDVEGMTREIAIATRMADELRQPRYIWYSAVWKVMRALLEGRFGDAQLLMKEALAMGERAEDPNAVLAFSVQMFIFCWMQGQLDQVVSRVEMLVQQYPALKGWRCVLALIYAELGRPEDAKKEVDQMAGEGLDNLPRDLFWPLAVSLLGEVAARLNDREKAETLYQLLSPFPGRWVIVGMVPSACIGSTSRYLGMLAGTGGRFDEAAAHFESAIAAHSATGARPWIAYTQHDYARILLHRGRDGDVRRAQVLLEASVSLSHDLRMEVLARRATETLTTLAHEHSAD
ncbi:MAG: AAA family ATPase [Actinobacteria bacterium]|nr:AAA family ATPase [Actinomycetota bacterium]